MFKKKSCLITPLSTIYLKRKCSGEWFSTFFGDLSRSEKLSEIKTPLAQWDLGISGLEWGLQNQNEGPLTLMKLRNQADGNFFFFKDKIKLVHYWSWNVLCRYFVAMIVYILLSEIFLKCYLHTFFHREQAQCWEKVVPIWD